MLKRKLRSLTAIIVMLCIMMSVFAVPVSATDTSTVFSDVKNKWYKVAVDYSYDNGFIAGVSDTEFGINVPVTRGMFITILARIAGVDTSKSANKVDTRFSDVANGKYYTNAIKWASEKGIVKGTTDTEFAPDNPIERQQLCTMVVNFALFVNVPIYDTQNPISFEDEAGILKYAREPVSVCQRAGIVSGYNTDSGIVFKPRDTATRAEAAQILYKFHNTFVKAQEQTDLLPSYSGSPIAQLDGNKPNFSESELTTVSYEKYAPLDMLGRCGVAIASIGKDIMPTEDRDSISIVKPTGWHSVQYDGQYLYNRCHLIGFQLAGENANEQNLITGTRYLNTQGMLPFENDVADFVEDTGYHVAYRVTPHYEGNNLVASGVQIEAFSIEDGGKGICFNIYCFNVQPGVVINYADGTSYEEGASQPPAEQPKPEVPDLFVIYDTPTGKRYHYDRECAGKNARQTTLEIAKSRGLDPCKTCVA